MRYFYELLWFSPEVVGKSEIDVFFQNFVWPSYGICNHEKTLKNYDLAE